MVGARVFGKAALQGTGLVTTDGVYDVLLKQKSCSRD